MPANLLWMEYILTGNEKEAESLWKLWLSNANTLVFRRLLQESHLRKQPQLIEKLITTLKSNEKISQGSLGNAYTRLINFHLNESNTNEALAAFDKAVKSGIPISNINKNCIEKLQAAAQAEGKQINFNV